MTNRMDEDIEHINLIMEYTKASREISPERLLLGSNNVPAKLRARVALQLALQGKFSHKLPSWASLSCYIPSRLALEQCSSEEVANYKKRFINLDDTLADLTGGMGVDFWALESVSEQPSYYVELQPELIQAARYNLSRLSSSPRRFLQANAEKMIPQLIESGVTFFYIDPARREGIDKGKQYHRQYSIEDCKPNVSELLQHLPQDGSIRLLAKLSPMLDLSDTLNKLTFISQLHIVAQKGEVKELLALIEPGVSLPTEEIPIIVSDVSSGLHFTFCLAQEKTSRALIADQPLSYLYLPHSGIMKAGCYRFLCQKYEVYKLHPNSHLYSSEKAVSDFPGKSFRIARIIPYHHKEVKALTQSLPAANLVSRNFPLSPLELRKKLKIREAESPYLVATTLSDGSLVLIEAIG